MAPRAARPLRGLKMKSSEEYKERDFALVLVDLQRKFADGTDGLKVTSAKALGTVNDAIRLFREHGRPVIYICFDGDSHGRHVENGDDFMEGLIPPAEGDVVLHKTAMNSFKGTDLEKVLADLGCDAMLLAGMVAQYCVLATYYGGLDRDLWPYMLEGGLAATDPGNIEAVERICRTLTVEEASLNKGFAGTDKVN